METGEKINSIPAEISADVKKSLEVKKHTLVGCLESFVEANVYDYDNGWYSGEGTDGQSTWNNWSGAKAELEDELGHELSDIESSILSLSLDYGPMPFFTKEESKELIKFFWPQGNHTGASKDITYMLEKFQEIFS